jgi:hypothetical protein
MSSSQSQTAQLAPSFPGSDASSAIAGLEQGLLGSLGTPTQQTLSELPLQQFTGSSGGAPANPGGLDPLHLITPVINALGTLGTGQFSGTDPTQTLSGISNAVDGNSGPLQQALGSIANDWQGESGTAANAATQAALANGAQVGSQADGLGNSLSTAASSVAQARQQMIEIIDEYHAKLAATDLSTHAGKAAAVAAGKQANTEAAAVMQELQDNLGSQAGQVSAIGSPVGVTQAPAAGASTAGAAGASTTGGLLGGLTGSSGLLGSNSLLGSIIQDLIDLLFLPLTMTKLSQEMAQTNTIMSGLGNTLTTTNGTIGHTNSIMHGLGNTLGTTNARLGATNSGLRTLNGEIPPLSSGVGTLNGEIPGLSSGVGTLDTDMPGLTHGVDKMDTDMPGLTHGVDKMDTDMPGLSKGVGKMDTEIPPLSSGVGKMDQEIPPLSSHLGYMDNIIHDANPLNDIPGLPPGLPLP